MDDLEDFISPIEEATNNVNPSYRPGRPRVSRTGKSGRPRKIYFDKLQSAMLKEKDTWAVTELPKGNKAINLMGLCVQEKLKRFICYKARLVAKICSQRHGVDYSKTFLPVDRYATIRMLLALAVEH